MFLLAGAAVALTAGTADAAVRSPPADLINVLEMMDWNKAAGEASGAKRSRRRPGMPWALSLHTRSDDLFNNLRTRTLLGRTPMTSKHFALVALLVLGTLVPLNGHSWSGE